MTARLMLLLLSRFASALGDQLLLFAVPLIVYRSSGSVRLSGLAFFIEWLPRILSLPLAGMISERLGGWRQYATADGVRALACGVVAGWAALSPSPPLGAVMALMGLCAFCYAQSFIALETTLPQLVPAARMATAQSALQSIDQGAAIAGPAAASLLMCWLSPLQLLWGVALVFGCSAGSAVLYRPLAAAGASTQRTLPLWQHWRHSGRRLLQHGPLRSLVLMSMAVNLIAGLALASGAAITLGRFGLNEQHFGSLQGSVGVLALLTLLLTPLLLRRLSLRRLGLASYGVILLAGLLMATAGHFRWFVLGYALCFAACGSFNVFMRSERLQWIEAQERGRMISLMVLCNQTSLPLAGLLVSLAGPWHGAQWLFFPACLLALLLILLLYPGLRQRTETAQMVRG